jgi:hypothetical protein
VDRSPRPAFLLSGDAPAFEATLTALGGKVEKKRLGDLWLFFNWVPPPYRFTRIPPENWRAYSNRGKAAVSAVTDQNLDTRWGLGRTMEPGDTFMLDLGRVWKDLGRVTLLAGTRGGLPRGLRLEISVDGREWQAPLSIPSYWDSLVWAGPHPFVRPEKGSVELVFPPRPGRYLKIVQTGSDDRYAWEIAEIQVYRAIPPAPGPSPAEAPRVADLLEQLRARGIAMVQADPWILAHLPAGYGTDPGADQNGNPLPEKGGHKKDPDRPFPAFAVWKEQAEALGEALGQQNPGIYRDLGLTDLTFFYPVHAEKHYSPLARSGWQASANFNPQEAWKAIDGKKESRWSSGVPQTPGMWFRLDLGRPASLCGLRLELGESLRDFPRELEIRFSLDGRHWREVRPLQPSLYWGGETLLREGSNGGGDFMIPETPARYIEFRQNGQDPTYYWSIHEIELYQSGNPQQ